MNKAMKTKILKVSFSVICDVEMALDNSYFGDHLTRTATDNWKLDDTEDLQFEVSEQLQRSGIEESDFWFETIEEF